MTRPAVVLVEAMTEIVIDSYECSGCGTCAELCPDVFQMDAFGEKAELVVPHPQITDDVYQAAAYCPEKCIKIIEDE